MSSGEIKLYNTLRARIGDEGAQELVGFVKSEIKNEIMDLKDVFLTKEDKGELIRSMKDIFLTKEDKVDLIREMKNDKVELILLMKKHNRQAHIFSLAQFLAIIAVLLGIISFLKNN